MKGRIVWALAIIGIALGVWLFSSPDVPDYSISDDPEAIERGRYLVHAAGCISCHINDDGSLSGGMAIESPFGTFYASNITPDPASGIGNWTGSDIVRAIKHGRSPDGAFYFPAFPYRSYAAMSDAEALDVAAWLMAQDAVSNNVPEHQLPGWVMRWQMAGWNKLVDFAEPATPMYDDQQIARGAYLTRHLGHCGECHSPRNSLGIINYDQEFAGGDMPDGHVAAINAEAMEKWSEDDLALFLFLGMKPDGEFVGGKMEPVIEHNTGQLTDEDRQAMAAFLKRGQ